jgi:hypothetical protein
MHTNTGRGHLLQKKYFGKEENTTATQQMLQQVCWSRVVVLFDPYAAAALDQSTPKTSTRTIFHLPLFNQPNANECILTYTYPKQVACFLHRELPIRLAHRVRDLDAMYVPIDCLIGWSIKFIN